MTQSGLWQVIPIIYQQVSNKLALSMGASLCEVVLSSFLGQEEEILFCE